VGISLIRIFLSRILGQTGIGSFYKYFSRKIVTRQSSRKYDPGCLSRIWIFPIPDPGVFKKAPDPGTGSATPEVKMMAGLFRRHQRRGRRRAGHKAGSRGPGAQNHGGQHAPHPLLSREVSPAGYLHNQCCGYGII
jgi:hypothetical protein